MAVRLGMSKFYPPLSQKDLSEKYSQEVKLNIPVDSDLWGFIQESHWQDMETVEDCVIRLLKERLSLSCQGF